METKPASKIYIVRIIDKKSNPMVGVTCPNGKLGAMCWDPKGRTIYPHTQVLIDPKSYNIIEVH